MKIRKGMYLRLVRIDNKSGTMSFTYRAKVTKHREGYVEGWFQCYEKDRRRYSSTCAATGGFFVDEHKITKIKPFKL